MNDAVTRIEGEAAAPRHFKYYDLIMAAFVAILLLSNIIGASKPSQVEDNAAAYGVTLSEQDIADIDALFAAK